MPEPGLVSCLYAQTSDIVERAAKTDKTHANCGENSSVIRLFLFNMAAVLLPPPLTPPPPPVGTHGEKRDITRLGLRFLLFFESNLLSPYFTLIWYRTEESVNVLGRLLQSNGCKMDRSKSNFPIACINCRIQIPNTFLIKSNIKLDIRQNEHRHKTACKSSILILVKSFEQHVLIWYCKPSRFLTGH